MNIEQKLKSLLIFVNETKALPVDSTVIFGWNKETLTVADVKHLLKLIRLADSVRNADAFTLDERRTRLSKHLIKIGEQS